MRLISTVLPLGRRTYRCEPYAHRANVRRVVRPRASTHSKEYRAVENQHTAVVISRPRLPRPYLALVAPMAPPGSRPASEAAYTHAIRYRVRPADAHRPRLLGCARRAARVGGNACANPLCCLAGRLPFAFSDGS